MKEGVLAKDGCFLSVVNKLDNQTTLLGHNLSTTRKNKLLDMDLEVLKLPSII